MTSAHPHDAQIRALYAAFLDGWNRRSGAAVAAGFADDGDVIGFDGSSNHGRLAIAADLRQIFASHQTPAYVGVVRSVRQVSDGVALLIAHAGMIPAGASDFDPDLHTVQHPRGGRGGRPVADRAPAEHAGAWHQHPEARDALTEELRGLLAPQ